MNRWFCDHHDCNNSCTGMGGAVGLRALGWFFAPGAGPFGGALTLCPRHRPDGADPKQCKDSGATSSAPAQCSCRLGIADRAAHSVQQLIVAQSLGI